MTQPKLITPRERDIGDFTVRRALPATGHRTVGPFVFFDHMGPVDFEPGKGIDVRPHPHIGLATLTYLFAGEIVHADSLGFRQPIRPGEVNWMTAGSGIVHSERTSDELRASGQRLHGIQVWVALPKAHEETKPEFLHYPAAATPTLERGRVNVRVIAGEAFGLKSPLTSFSRLVYLDMDVMARAELKIPVDYSERAIYVADGLVYLDGVAVTPGTMAVLPEGKTVLMESDGGGRAVMIGGEPLDGDRHLWWNFVSSDFARIDKAKKDWSEGRFDKVKGETDFIPLPKI